MKNRRMICAREFMLCAAVIVLLALPLLIETPMAGLAVVAILAAALLGLSVNRGDDSRRG